MALEEVTDGIAQPPPVKQGPATEIISGVAGWAVLHNIADSGVTRFEAEFVKQVARSSNLNREAILSALKNRNRQQALQIASDTWKQHSQEWKKQVTEQLTGTVAKAAQTVSERVLTNPSAIQFDVTNPLATKWARSQAGLLIDKVGENQKVVIRNIIADGFEQGLTPQKIQKQLLGQIGLQSRQQVALERFRQDLIAKGINQSNIDKQVARYQKKLLKARARSIARTELMRASNQGQQLLWEEAIAQGHMNPGAFEKVWITTPDDRLCPFCRAKNGDRVGVFDYFSNPIGTPEPQPPLHPMCRCSTALVKKGKGAPKVPEGDTKRSTPTTGKATKVTKKKKPEPKKGPGPPVENMEVETRFRHTTGVDKAGNLIYTAERLKLHDEILEYTLEGTRDKAGKLIVKATAQENPIAVVLGGGPASGKTAAKEASQLLVKKNVASVDVDDVRTFFPEYKRLTKVKSPNAAAITHEEASDLAKRIVKEGQRRKLNVIIDGTGDNKYEKLAKKVKTYRQDGATKIVANYVTIDTDEAVKRMLSRAARSGRYVPEKVLRETHASVSKILPRAIDDDLFDTLVLWDNNAEGKAAEIIARWEKGKPLEILDRKKWEKFVAKGDEGLVKGTEKIYKSKWPISDTGPRKLLQKFENQVEESYGPYVKGLPKTTRKDIASYTSGAYKRINRRLRMNPQQPLSGRDAAIQRATMNGPSPPPPKLVWRGVETRYYDDVAEAAKVGDVIKLDGFQSCSINPLEGARIGKQGIVMEIKPARGVWVKDLSTYKFESEYLLPHRAQYRVVGRKKVVMEQRLTSDGRRIRKQVEVIQLEMIPPEVAKKAVKKVKKVPVKDPPQLLEVETWKRHSVGVDKKGNPIYSSQRLKLHNEILEKTLKGATPVERPEVVVLGGGPAAGKTAAKNASRARFKGNVAAVDVDDIRTMFPEYDELLGLTAKDQGQLKAMRTRLGKKNLSEAEIDKRVAKYKAKLVEVKAKAGLVNTEAAAITHEEASDLAKRIITEGQRRKLNVIADGTGDNSYNKLKGKVAGYRANGATKVTGNYVSIPADDAMGRMLGRAKRTGRYVPEKVLRGTHASVSRIVPDALTDDLFDSFTLWDNSGAAGTPAKIVAKWTKKTPLEITDRKKWKSFLAKGEEGLDAKGVRDYKRTARAVDGLEKEAREAWPVSDSMVRYTGSEEYQEQVQKRYREYVKRLPKKTQEEIEKYSNVEFFSINQRLRDFPNRQLTDKDLLIQRAIDDAPKPPPPELVWRGVGDTASSEEANRAFSVFKDGDVIDLAGFQSTTMNPLMAKNWGGYTEGTTKVGGTVFEIKPKRGMFIGDISAHPDELEFLIPHNAKYKVIGRKKVKIGAERYETLDYDVKATTEELRVMAIRPADQTVEEVRTFAKWRKRAVSIEKRKVEGEITVVQLEML